MTNRKYGINLKKFVLGSFLLVFSLLSLLWMFGFFSVPVELQSSTSHSLQEWSAPGVMPFSFAVSIVAGLVGMLLVVTSFKLTHSKQRKSYEL
jgi:hypothetical protein